MDYLDASEPMTAVPIRFLPQEMVFHILLHLPAQVIHDVMKHVCREWNLMIRSPYFIRHHLRNSTSGIIIQHYSETHNAIYVEIRRGRLEISKFDFGSGYLVHTSCNGLTLIRDSRDLYTLCVINRLTKQRAVLPRFFRRKCWQSQFIIAFAEASMEYKVVHAFGCGPLKPADRIFMLTIGVDRVWRPIGVEHLPPTARTAFRAFPLATRGYVLWIFREFVLTLNVETETFCEFSIPPLLKTSRYFLPMGSNLSVVCGSSKLSRDVWEMNSETGEWSMLLSFDLKPVRHRLKGFFDAIEETVVPVGWLADREVLALVSSFNQRRCIVYNVKTGEIKSFDLDTDCPKNEAKVYNFVPHVSTFSLPSSGRSQSAACVLKNELATHRRWLGEGNPPEP